MAALETEFPDWASVIAANLVIDGILTTFVAAVRDSSIEPLAQRARKILQEEGAHKVHAEAWVKRICRRGGDDLELLLRRIGEMWGQAARWVGPNDHAGYRQAMTERMIAWTPDQIRAAVRDWLTELLHKEGTGLKLRDDVDWSVWDEETRR
jgi:1,2-phenylacetyl-CoA epoxidase catalytic subunit